MNIAIPKETAPGERRVAIVPDSVRRLLKHGYEISIESEAGAGAHVPDSAYRDAGASVEPAIESLLGSADVVVKVQMPSTRELDLLREGSALVSFLSPLVNVDLVRALAAKKITAIAVDSIPRTTLAQTFDALSSQATVAGYGAVILAARALPKLFPMLMTAAGTIAPARVLVLGAGVAGLQAIATSRRLGAAVEAFDVRKAVKEEVESLGAKFIGVDALEDATGEGGYARAVSEEFKRKEHELIRAHVAKADICITTALVPGTRAPILITEEMVRDMRPGSVIVDLAGEQGGNCELTQPGQEIVRHEVTILAPVNLPSALPVHASQMYSRNMENLLLYLGRQGRLQIDLGEEIARGCVVTHEGQIVHPALRDRLTQQGGR
ncbi:MAG: Re/Si-specific NAD(P)(+) transhydrogenase subunit alpha [Candidatus Methylomirabilia bacterium]